MFAILIIVAAATPSPSIPSFAANVSIVQSKDFDERLAEAGEDVDKLWSLYLWCEAGGRAREGKTILRKIVDLDPSHREANTGLGHIEYRGRWFRNQRKLDDFKREEEEQDALERGLVRFKDEWVAKHDLPYLQRGLVRGPDGRWVTREEQALLEQGWVRQDLEWIEPDEANNIDQGLWKCGDEWLPLSDANRYHSRLGHWWKFPTRHFVLYSTLDREQALEAGEVLDRTFDDLVRVFGRAPESAPTVIVLRSSEQYSQLAKGGEEARPADGSGFSSVHYAYFADDGMDPVTKKFWGAGIAYWDNTSDAGKRFGRLAARHGAGQAFGNAIDASPKTIEKAEKKPERAMNVDAFYEEKSFPSWFRFGAATYVERYFVDNLVAADGDARWAKTWSVENLMQQGGLIPLSTFFERPIDVFDPETARKWINQSGLIMAFILDGGVEGIGKAHRELIEAQEKGKRTDKLVAELESVILQHENELQAFMKQP